MALTGAEVRTGVEVTGLDRAAKAVTARDLETGEVFTESYDKLVISTGAHPFVPQCEGVDLENVFFMRTPDDADSLRKKVDARRTEAGGRRGRRPHRPGGGGESGGTGA